MQGDQPWCTFTMATLAMQQVGLDLILNLSPFLVWHHGDAMEIVNFPQDKFMKLGASGACPHCAVNSYFQQVAVHFEKPLNVQNQWQQRAAAICECCACKNFLLVVGKRRSAQGMQLDNGHVNAG